MRKLLLTVTIILFVILLSFKFYIFNIDYYDEEFSKLGVYEKFSQKQALNNTQELIAYLRDNEQLTTGFFNEKEKQHLIDVRNLINKTIILFYISLILLILLIILNRKQLKKPMLYSGISLVIIPLLLPLLNFQSVFIQFHQIFFNNNLWILNPETDNLINLFPEQFFLNFVKKIFTNSLIIGIILIILSFFIKKPKTTPKILSKIFKKNIPPN